ncbi:MAG: AGE family epimerase/isomerase [Fibromonadaceae bacterium]|jgi:mannose/cellobiose epimerase-like protein (N-acyl-D-glucosamine 2-epimerase family)|nr:AGE family epimerase/isomerase [Fibromonadaceae bacterium]
MSNSNKYRHDRYINIKNLIDTHKDLIESDKFTGKNRWLEHLERELMPFWMKDGVKKMSLEGKGLFRSFFTDAGEQLPGLKDISKWPETLRKAIEKNEDGEYATEAGSLLEGDDYNADKNFVRSHSRQVFAYGIAYHMTGKAEYFDLCRKGAYVLMGLVDKHGSMYTKQELSSEKYIEDADTRTSQDLAYGMSGIAFYYYLTHDENAHKKIFDLYNYIKKTYYDPGKDLYTWFPKDKAENQKVELVAHLDQIYGYMLWLTPALPPEEKTAFKAEMKKLVKIMIERFYSEVQGTFWGASNSSEMLTLGAAHTDFGHSVKAMWVIYQVGIWVEEPYFVNFARRKIHKILENAYDVANGSWNRRFLKDGTIDKDKEWWSLAELNQAAAILAIKDPTYLQYLNKTYAFWFKNMIDLSHGEIWHALDGETLRPKRFFPKVHCWKNGFHSLEHTLLGYLTSQQILDKEMELYYAFESLGEVKYQQVTPYFFKANITDKKVEGEIPAGDGDTANRKSIKVTFNSLH